MGHRRCWREFPHPHCCQGQLLPFGSIPFLQATLQAVLQRIESCTHTKAKSDFHTIWSQSLHVVNAKDRAIPARQNPWVKGFLPHIYSKKEKSVLLHSDIE
jgi:hypothetical protein